MQGADQHLIGWTEWAYSGQGDITTSASPPGSESLVYDPELSPTGSNVNTANLITLAEPYPQVISGTPTSYSFENGTFDFSLLHRRGRRPGQLPRRLGDHRLGAGGRVPQWLRRGRHRRDVVSAPDASELVIASDNGASTVTVVVTSAAVGGAAAG